MGQYHYRALILDDEYEIAQALSEILNREGIETVSATDIQQGINYLDRYTFDIVISDFYMPGGNGAALFDVVRESYPNLPFMIITGKPDADTAIRMLKGGVCDFLIKPISLATFSNKVKKAIQKSRKNAVQQQLMTDLRGVLNKRVKELRIFQDLFESRREGLLILDTTGMIIKVNRGFRHMSGLAEEALIDKRIFQIPNLFKTRLSFRSVISSLKQQGKWQREFELKTAGRDPWIANIACSPMKEESGQTFAYAVVITDITEKRAIQTALVDSLQQHSMANEAIIFGLARLAEYRDPETGFHLEKIRSYCRILATAMSDDLRFEEKISEHFISVLFKAAPLHDIGKVGIPDRILLKKGRLDEVEFRRMQTHTTIGFETLLAIREQYGETDLLKMGMDIAHAHHEKYDGSGYPNGLSGEDIPLSAQITAIADVYDALTSKRIYKPPFSHENALEIMARDRGSHFNPYIFDIFLDTQREFNQVRREFATRVANKAPIGLLPGKSQRT
ncbi:MAG: HD domain-containing phosphohydrolase [Calditrichia bacterium]